jgi:NTP pyrophosphatase (non-canonical NTP hydrolase)
MTSTLETMPTDHHFSTLAEYQSWAAENWIYPAGSQEFQLHSRAKLSQEAEELKAELSSSDPTGLRSELGDFFWCATTTADNSGLLLEDSLRFAFAGVFKEDSPIPVATVDRAVEDWAPSSDEELMWKIDGLAHSLGKNAKQWHALKQYVDLNAEPTGFSDAWIQLKAKHSMYALAEVVITVSHIAQQRLGLSLSDIMDDNYQKLTGRIERGENVTKPVL